MNKIYVKIKGIHCNNCITKITESLLKITNIKNVEIKKDIACITYKNKIDLDNIIKVINDLDYETNKDYISSDINEIDNTIKFKEFIIIFIFILFIIFILKKIFGFNIFNLIPVIDSNITYKMLFITGLFTSIHCISMCGSINLVATYNDTVKISLKKPLLYNLGRVISYTILGGIVGLIGSIISINNYIKGIIILTCSILMIMMSFRMLGILKFNFCKFKIRPKIKTNSSFLIGLLNGFMPCGPLQAMQLYAISTSSFITGALSMFLFSLGTVPLMLFTGVIFNLFKGKKRIIMNKVSAILILILSISMLNRGLLTLGINLNFNNYNEYTSSIIYDGYQEVTFDLTYDNYQDIIIEKDIPVRMIINVSEKYLTGCNEEIYIDEYKVKKKLEVGENIIEFTPTSVGEFTYNCYMNMIKNKIKVIDDESYFKKGE
jgi:sulfite exporter TauE/SafE/copper chaperone CopZ